MHLDNRLKEIRLLRLQLERDGFPRLQMFLIVAITSGAGFLASYGLLHAGLTEMWVRYLCALGIAYLVFLFLLWVWLRTSAKDYDSLDFSGLMPSGRSGDVASGYAGKGGNFGGGGASGSFDRPAPTSIAFDDSAASATTEGEDVLGEALGAAAQAEELSIPLVVLVLLGAVLLSSLLIVYSAPAFFAELLFDGALAATLYHRLRGLESRHWLETAFRRTTIPFTATAVVVVISSLAMQHYAPEAHSIGDVIRHARQAR